MLDITVILIADEGVSTITGETVKTETFKAKDNYQPPEGWKPHEFFWDKVDAKDRAEELKRLRSRK